MYSVADLGKRYAKLITYIPHQIQEKLHVDNHKIRAYFGGNRSGKTTFGAVETLWWCLGMHRYRDDIPEPPIQARVCCTDFINGIKKIILPEFYKWIPEDARHWHAEARVLELENGSTIEMLSYDQDISKYGGVSRSLIWHDEEPSYEIYTENMMRTADVGGSLLLTATPIKGLCFDEETEILSRRGWVNYKNLRIGDDILTLNTTLDGILFGITLEWKEATGIYVNENYNGPMIHMRCQGFDALVTPDHRWPVRNKNNNRLEIKETQNLKTHHKIYRAIENTIGIIDPIYKDWFVELAGWFLTDGTSPEKKRYVKLYQSETRYPDKCEKIRTILSNFDDWYEKPYRYSKGIINHWCINGMVADDLRTIFPTRELTNRFVFRLTKEQQRLLYDTLIDGDGTRSATGDRLRGTEQTLDAFQTLCVLLGKRCTVGSEVTRKGKIVFQAWIQKENGRYSPFTHVQSLSMKHIGFNGPIWCPHTSNNTVVARRNGTVYISHNTWMYDRLYEMEGVDPNVKCEVATIWDNPHLNKDEIKILEASMHPDEREVRLEGRFIPKSGLIYKEFGPKHVIPWFKIPEDWTIILGIDPHDRNPHAVVFCAVNREDDIFIFDEIYEHCLIEELAKRIKEKLELIDPIKKRITPAYSVIDPSAETKDMITGRSYKEELGMKHGLFCIAAHRDVNAGISKVREYLNFKNKAPNIFIMEPCRETIREFRHYIWDDYMKKERFNPKEKPLKKHDHLLDCHDAQTEILAESGWKLFKDLDQKEKVATLNPETWYLEYQKPIDYIEKPYSGKMLLCDGMTTNFCITPNHRLYSSCQYNYKKAKNNKFELGIIDKFGVEFPIKKNSKWLGRYQKHYSLGDYNIPMEDWLEFLGIYLSEGFKSYSHYQTLIAQSTDSKYFEDIKEILDKIPLKFKYDGSCKRFYCMSKLLYEEMLPLGTSGNKYIPKHVKELSSDLLEHLMYGLMLGDGTISVDCSYSNDKYDSCSKQLVDDIQEIALKIRKYGNVNSYKGLSFVSPTNGKRYKGNDTFRINFSKGNGYTTVNIKKNLHEIDYLGDIHCVSVPNGIIYTRRNGRAMWGGNSIRYVLMTNPHYHVPKHKQEIPKYKPLYPNMAY